MFFNSVENVAGPVVVVPYVRKVYPGNYIGSKCRAYERKKGLDFSLAKDSPRDFFLLKKLYSSFFSAFDNDPIFGLLYRYDRCEKGGLQKK